MSYPIELKLTDEDKTRLKGDIDGLFGRMPPELRRLVRHIVDAPNYDYAAMAFLDGSEFDWRENVT